ncbi:TetR/AcrR family transcriptional regulator [Mycolicibacterium sp.]|jgi:AcrR family transcriptional regulator|uniref:TetR/AcrR family transcriptional regulator n=1 Tax=Mycolicibacterium sp. TaxID=2320850 RepID=UPI0028A9E518|nr:TetR/AcrR family transcriptional regulator [Mycolicibacterium sp.]
MAVARRAATDLPTNTAPGAAATRQRLLDAAVDLFIETGYFATNLTDITSRASVTTGAFYHHFASKEAIAMAIVERGWSTVLTEVTRCLNKPGPGLERVIVMSFQLSELMKRDRSVGIANHLAQAFGQLSIDGRESFHQHVKRFIRQVADALGDTELREDVNPTQAASLVWICLQGCHQLSDALMDNGAHVEQIHLSWMVGLPSMVTPAALPHYEQFATQLAGRHTEPDRYRRWPG